MRNLATVQSVIESRAETGAKGQPGAPPGADSVASAGGAATAEPATAYPLEALESLTVTVESCCEDLFSAAPFAGDQATGYSIDAFVDAVAAALRAVQSEADDLRRVMTIAQRRAVSEGDGPT